MKLAVLVLAPLMLIAATTNANTNFSRVYAGGQFISSSIGFRLGGEYVFNDNILATGDYRLYGADDFTYSFTRLEGGLLFPIDSSQSPIPNLENISAYALGGLAILTYDIGTTTSDTAISLRGGVRADVINKVWTDISLGLLGSGRGLTLGVEAGYQINDSFDVSAFLDFGSFESGGLGILGSFKF